MSKYSLAGSLLLMLSVAVSAAEKTKHRRDLG